MQDIYDLLGKIVKKDKPLYKDDPLYAVIAGYSYGTKRCIIKEFGMNQHSVYKGSLDTFYSIDDVDAAINEMTMPLRKDLKILNEDTRIKSNELQEVLQAYKDIKEKAAEKENSRNELPKVMNSVKEVDRQIKRLEVLVKEFVKKANDIYYGEAERQEFKRKRDIYVHELACEKKAMRHLKKRVYHYYGDNLEKFQNIKELSNEVDQDVRACNKLIDTINALNQKKQAARDDCKMLSTI